jgi:plasmid stability protein
MARITIRGLDERTMARLRDRAADHQRSIEDEALSILREALAQDASVPRNLAEAIRRRFALLGGIELELPPRRRS